MWSCVIIIKNKDSEQKYVNSVILPQFSTDSIIVLFNYLWRGFGIADQRFDGRPKCITGKGWFLRYIGKF